MIVPSFPRKRESRSDSELDSRFRGNDGRAHERRDKIWPIRPPTDFRSTRAARSSTASSCAEEFGIRFKGKERTDVEEYSISEGWIRVAAGRSMDRYGQPMTIKLKGEVDPFFQDAKAAEKGETAEADASEGEEA